MLIMTVEVVCPLCGNAQISSTLSVKDYSISQETFQLKKCNSCTFLFTTPVPDQDTIGRYYASDVYISHTDSNKGVIEQLYQLVRKRTLAGKRKLIASLTQREKGSILDYGCGTGAFLHEMNLNGWEAHGIEPDAGARAKAEQLIGSAVGLPSELKHLPTQAYDVVTMWHVLEHVHDLNGTIQELKRLLKPEGKLFVAVPNHQSFDAKHYGSHWAAYDVPRHLHHFSPDTMKSLMERHGLKIVVKKGMWFDSFYVSMLSEKYKAGKINYFKAFFIGLVSNLIAFLKVEKCSSLIYVISK
jgi:2-polyprenyl-3-methyl-5-hydroxy-6-metoxy-1,4-benzoquinol methylase